MLKLLWFNLSHSHFYRHISTQIFICKTRIPVEILYAEIPTLHLNIVPILYRIISRAVNSCYRVVNIKPMEEKLHVYFVYIMKH